MELELSEKTTDELMEIVANIGDVLPAHGTQYTPDNVTRLALYCLTLILQTGNDYAPIDILTAAVQKVGSELEDKE